MSSCLTVWFINYVLRPWSALAPRQTRPATSGATLWVYEQVINARAPSGENNPFYVIRATLRTLVFHFQSLQNDYDVPDESVIVVEESNEYECQAQVPSSRLVSW